VEKFRKGSWVQIELTLRKSSERPEHLPPETRRVSSHMRAKGLLAEEASFRSSAFVLSTCGGPLTDTLAAENPPFTRSFGPKVTALTGLDDFLRSFWRTTNISYENVMAHKNEIMKKHLLMDFGQFERLQLPFDSDGMMNQHCHAMDEKGKGFQPEILHHGTYGLRHSFRDVPRTLSDRREPWRRLTE